MSHDPDAYRDAKTGQFVSEETAQAEPDRTVPVDFPLDTVWVLSWYDTRDRAGIDSVYTVEEVARKRLAELDEQQEARVRVRQAAGYQAHRQVWYTLAPYAITRKADG